VRLVIDSISAFWADKPVMARKYSYDLKIALHRENVTAYLVSQYAMTTKSTFGFGLEHIADGVLHLWMDDVERRRGG
jgi:KaiC/GvpD/RAD55 family RecA-like ATPase